MKQPNITGSLVMAAGRGSRMKGYAGNKTLLPLLPGPSPFEGQRPMLIHILEGLPPGPKGLVVHHRKEDVIAATAHLGVRFYEQPVLNGTGGALLAARAFVEKDSFSNLLITMGDVPFIRQETYHRLLESLEEHPLVVLGFLPRDKKQYGVLETRDQDLLKIIEWKYWHHFPEEEQRKYTLCNSGIYAARRRDLLRVLPALEARPHRVIKERDGKKVEFEEYFITDLVEHIRAGGGRVGYVIAGDEQEVMGLDDQPALAMAQALYAEKRV